MATVRAELQQLQQQLAAKDASMTELQQETERRAADSGEAREQLRQLQQQVAELQAQLASAAQQAQQRVSQVSTAGAHQRWCDAYLAARHAPYYLDEHGCLKENRQIAVQIKCVR